MKAAVWTGINRIEVIEVEMPSPKRGEVLLKVISAGLCITDLHVYTGEFAYGAPPHILGHEIAGEVVSLGNEVDPSYMGARVVVETSIGCGTCPACRKGNRHHCVNGTEIGFTPHPGGYSQYVCVPAANLFRIPDSVSYDEAGIIESLVCPFGGLYRLGVGFGETIAVYGVGPAGLAFIQAARIMGAGKIIAIVRNEERVARAKHFGADVVINSASGNVNRTMMELTGGLGADTVCEAAGALETIEESFRIVKKAGRVILYGIPSDRAKIQFPVAKIITEQLEVHGIVGNPDVWEPLLRMVEKGAVNLKDMITHRFSLDDINEAFDALRNKKSDIIKAVIKPWERQ